MATKKTGKAEQGLTKTAAHMSGEHKGLRITSGLKRLGIKHEDPRHIDAKAIREHLGMTQTLFSQTFFIPLPTVRDWEEGSTQPDEGARILLRLIQKNPGWMKRKIRELPVIQACGRC